MHVAAVRQLHFISIHCVPFHFTPFDVHSTPLHLFPCCFSCSQLVYIIVSLASSMYMYLCSSAVVISASASSQTLSHTHKHKQYNTANNTELGRFGSMSYSRSVRSNIATVFCARCVLRQVGVCFWCVVCAFLCFSSVAFCG